jgi:organic radical activating enzyme
MNIVGTQYSFKYRSLEIVHSGCDGLCNGCHSRELWDYSIGTNYRLWIDIFDDKIKEFTHLIDWIWIYGGEPLLQTRASLIDLLDILKQYDKPIVLFTRFDFHEIPDNIMELCDYIKCGMYDETLRGAKVEHGIELMSLNQKVFKING